MRLFSRPRIAAPVLAFALLCSARAQVSPASPANSPAVTPAGVPSRPAVPATISQHQALEADNAYLAGARALERDDLATAEKSFQRALELNPNKSEYALSLAVTREHRVTELVQQAARARQVGNNDRADALLVQARNIDPKNPIITQHFNTDNVPTPWQPVTFEQLRSRVPALSGILHLQPTPGKKDIHHRGSPADVIRESYQDFGIKTTFDTSVTGGAPVRLDLDQVSFDDVQRIVEEMTHTFTVAVQPQTALIAHDSQDNRDRLLPLLEETVYVPGPTTDAMTELANLARNIFDLKQVTASFTGGYIVLRGDERTLTTLNELYADMLDGGADVLLDIHLYEIDNSHMVKVGADLPTSISAFSFLTTAQNLLNANQSTIQQAIAANVLNITGLSEADADAKELFFLIGAGIVSSTQFSNLLGVLGTYGGLPLLGISIGSTGTFNLLLNNSDVRILDQAQIRGHSGEDAEFRTGTRYPIVTATYSSGVSSALTSQLAGVNINGTSAASLLAQYGGASSASVPQIQYEDLGITLKAKPHIQRDDDVNVKLDLKIEAIGSGSLNSIPVLNNRSMTSVVTIPAGQTALIASAITRSEMRAIDGIPGLSELPGFQGTDKSKDVDSGELLLTITPHIVRTQRLRITSRLIAVEHTSGK